MNDTQGTPRWDGVERRKHTAPPAPAAPAAVPAAMVPIGTARRFAWRVAEAALARPAATCWARGRTSWPCTRSRTGTDTTAGVPAAAVAVGTEKGWGPGRRAGTSDIRSPLSPAPSRGRDGSGTSVQAPPALVGVGGRGISPVVRTLRSWGRPCGGPQERQVTRGGR